MGDGRRGQKDIENRRSLHRVYTLRFLLVFHPSSIIDNGSKVRGMADGHDRCVDSMMLMLSFS